MMVTWDNESQLSIDPSLIGASIETYLHSKLTVGAWVTRPVYLGTSKTQIYLDIYFCYILYQEMLLSILGGSFEYLVILCFFTQK